MRKQSYSCRDGDVELQFLKKMLAADYKFSYH
jgi:hypothetical protein